MIYKAHTTSALLLLLSAVTLTQAQEVTSSSAPEGHSLQATQAELVRRQEVVFSAMQSLGDAEKFLGSGDLEKAAERFEFSLKNLPSGEQTVLARGRATKGLATSKARLSVKALDQGQRDKALLLAQDAVKLADTSESRAALKSVQEDIKRFEQARKNPESSVNNPAVTPQFEDKVEVVSKLFFEGEQFFTTGQYDKAIGAYEKILSIDPYNKAARKKIERVERSKLQSSLKGRQQARAEALYQIESRWSEPVLVDGGASKVSTDTATPSNLAKMTRKLQNIMIPNLQFNDVAIEDAVKFLADKSRELDPDKEGINFVLKKETTPQIAPPPAGGAAAPADAAPVAPISIQFTPVTLKLEKPTSLEQVLNVLTQLTPLKYKVEEFAVYLLPLTETSEVLQTRTFSVPGGFLKGGGLKSAATNAAAGARNLTAQNAESVKINVIEELQSKGVVFPTGATAAYLSSSNKLVVKNTPDQLDIIQTLVESQQQEAQQIEIETKFAEFTEDSLKEMAFNWYLSLKNNPSLSRIPNISSFPGSSVLDPFNFISNFTPGNYQGDIAASSRNRAETDINGAGLDNLLLQNTSGLTGASPVNVLTGGTLGVNTPSTFRLGGVIDGRGFMLLANLIDQTRGIDLLSAPKITTRSQTTAKIEIVREMRYPETFQKPQFNGQPVGFDGDPDDLFGLTGTQRQVILLAPPTPQDFKIQNIGVTMEVTPRAYADRRIDLDITPEVVDFEGFVDYGDTVNQGELFSNEIRPLSRYTIQQPVFSIRNLKTKVQVVDGQTIAMGGLIREDNQKIKDKVPFLGDLPLVGRLFRSEVDKTVKRNLMIFVTARLIRSTGKPQFVQTALLEPVPAKQANPVEATTR